MPRRMHVARTASRSKRRARLRFTALPTDVLTVNPTRAGAVVSLGAATQVSNEVLARDPLRTTCAKSAEEVNRRGRGIRMNGAAVRR